MKHAVILPVIALCFWILMGCQPGGADGKQGQISSPTASPTPKVVGGSIPAGSDAQVAEVKNDAAKRLGVSADAVQITSVQEEQWGDTSLGCPEPGKMYAQVITPGYRITAEVQGKVYEYHTDRGSRVVLCSK